MSLDVQSVRTYIQSLLNYCCIFGHPCKHNRSDTSFVTECRMNYPSDDLLEANARSNVSAQNPVENLFTICLCYIGLCSVTEVAICDWPKPHLVHTALQSSAPRSFKDCYVTSACIHEQKACASHERNEFCNEIIPQYGQTCLGAGCSDLGAKIDDTVAQQRQSFARFPVQA